jgi:hypothetical protein
MNWSLKLVACVWPKIWKKIYKLVNVKEWKKEAGKVYRPGWSSGVVSFPLGGLRFPSHFVFAIRAKRNVCTDAPKMCAAFPFYFYTFFFFFFFNDVTIEVSHACRILKSHFFYSPKKAVCVFPPGITRWLPFGENLWKTPPLFPLSAALMYPL